MRQKVIFSEEALNVLGSAVYNNRNKASKLVRICRNKEEAIDLIKQVIRQDIRSTHQGRGSFNAEENRHEEYHCHLDKFAITFTATTAGYHMTSIVDQGTHTK